MASLINSLEIGLICSIKSPLAPLYQKGVIPPFVEELVLSLSKERAGAIYWKFPDNYETINT